MWWLSLIRRWISVFLSHSSQQREAAHSASALWLCAGERRWTELPGGRHDQPHQPGGWELVWGCRSRQGRLLPHQLRGSRRTHLLGVGAGLSRVRNRACDRLLCLIVTTVLPWAAVKRGGRHHRPSTTEVSTLRRCGAIKVHVALNSQLVSELELFWKRRVSELTIQTEPSLLWTFSVISLYGATTTDGQHTPRRAELVQSRVEGRDCTCWCVFYWRLWSTSSYLSPQSIVWDLVLDCSRSAWVCRQPTSRCTVHSLVILCEWRGRVVGGDVLLDSWTEDWAMPPTHSQVRSPFPGIPRRRHHAAAGPFFPCRIACLVCS